MATHNAHDLAPNQPRRGNMNRAPSLPAQNHLDRPAGAGATPMRRQETTHGNFAPQTADTARGPTDRDLVQSPPDGAPQGPAQPASYPAEKQAGQDSPEEPKPPRRRRATLIAALEENMIGQHYILMLTKALLHFGAPSHRIEEALARASTIVGVKGHFAYFPGLVVASLDNPDGATSAGHHIKANGHVALSTLHRIHMISSRVQHDKVSVTRGIEELKALLHAPPCYTKLQRCLFAFLCAACISPLEFGGSIVDMGVAGLCAALLQALKMWVASKNETFDTVFEITLAMVISFIARMMSTIPGNMFCYNAISSAGIIFILPGFIVLMASLEITSDNVLCGAVRMVYAIIYTLFLGFSLSQGSNIWLGLAPDAKKNLLALATKIASPEVINGTFVSANETDAVSVAGQFVLMNTAELSKNVMEGCFRDPSWGWWRQPLPWWSMFILVPIFSMGKSLSNLQSWRSIDFPVMIFFSCFTFISTRVCRLLLSSRPEVISFVGAFAIGMCGCLWSRVYQRTAFTVSVTGVLFLVPVALAGDNGLSAVEDSNRTQGVLLAMRMIQVAVGVVTGIFMSHTIVYAIGPKKSTGRFTF